MSVQKATKVYRGFHGRTVRKKREIPFIQPKTLVYLGRAIAIEYECDKINGTPAGGEGDLAVYRHECHEDNILCTDESGRQLYLLGPHQRVTPRGIID